METNDFNLPKNPQEIKGFSESENISENTNSIQNENIDDTPLNELYVEDLKNGFYIGLRSIEKLNTLHKLYCKIKSDLTKNR